MTLTRGEREAFVEATRKVRGGESSALAGDDARQFMVQRGGGG